MAQVPHVKTCVAIYQLSPIPPIQYLVGRLLFVDNLTNKQAFLSYTHDYAENIPSLNRVATNQPRTVGLTLQFHY
jgi:hypothetical protein